MGGDNLIIAATAAESVAQAAMEAAAREVLRIEAKYSRYRDDDNSIVRQINRRAGSGEWTCCDAETLALLGLADRFHRESQGLFDITSGVLRKVWDFKTHRVPTAEEVQPMLDRIGWVKVELEGECARLSLPGMEVDFGGFGKEYAADRAAAIMRDHGINSGLVNLGGDIHVLGPRPDGSGWPIGVENPRYPGEVVATIAVSQGGLATSGDAQKYFLADGRRYSHIINPYTGFPVDCWASVTVASVSTSLAGLYSTTAMLMERSGEEFLRNRNCAFIMIDRDGKRCS